MRLARALVELPEKTLDRLALPEDLLDVVTKARRVHDGGPKNRALRLVRIVLRDGDAPSIERALREVHEPPRPGTRPLRVTAPTEVDEWRDKLIAGGEQALTDLVGAHPDADRRQLRQLVRNVNKASAAARDHAVKTLEKALRAILR